MVYRGEMLLSCQVHMMLPKHMYVVYGLYPVAQATFTYIYGIDRAVLVANIQEEVRAGGRRAAIQARTSEV